MRFAFLISLACVLGCPGYSQYYSTGQDPASVSWRQLKTDRYNLIYPASFEPKAQYLANIMDIVARHETCTLHARVPRIPLLLHTQSALSNGITVWAPKRIELYPCAPQQSYPEEWLEQLAVHEYRHAVQISKINAGFTKVLGYLFGEQVTGAVLGLYIPTWFLEGDATITETALTNTGRGRSALFESTLKAQVVEKGPYSFDKATLGSYKTFIPDAYSLGYYITGQARKIYGAGVWNAALDRTARFPFMVVPFNSGIHKVTGLWKTQLYQKSLAELDSNWHKTLRESSCTPMRYLTKRNRKSYASYNNPLVLNDSLLLADKSSVDDVDRYVIINRNTGREKRLLTPGFHISGTISAGGSFLVWTGINSDKRWGNRDYTVIRLYDFRTGKTRDLTHKTRYFSPVLTQDGSQLATMYVSPENQCFIDILGVPSGNRLIRFPMPGHCQVSSPAWSPDGKRIIFILLNEKGESLADLDIETGKTRTLLPFSFNEITGPVRFYRNFIIYSLDRAGSLNIYALDTLSRVVSRISNGRYATFHPAFSPDHKFMICSDYTSDGLQVAEIPVDPASWIHVDLGTDQSCRLHEAMAKQETVNIQDSVFDRKLYKMNGSGAFNLEADTIRATLYPTRKYSKLRHLFNPHSWAPASFDVSNLTISPGVMLLSQNTLSTMIAGAGWEYNVNEQTGKFYTSISYRGWYPQVDFRFDLGNRAAYFTYRGSPELHRFTWQETNASIMLSIPWNFSHGTYIRSLQPALGTSLIGVLHNASTPDRFTSGMIQTMAYQLSATQYLQMNQKDLYPRFGQSISISYYNTPFGGNNLGSLFGSSINLYLPGIFRHQGICLYAGYQARREHYIPSYSFADIIRYPRGYSGAYDRDLYSFSANYKFPLLYPDLSLGSVVYLKRIKLNLFYDWANGINRGYINNYQSTGGELTADFHLLRFIAPLEMGIRTVFYPAAGGYGFEFLYAITY
ncbi:MAG: hypothetical protein WCO44_08395 [Bacteroidota bacterium]